MAAVALHCACCCCQTGVVAEGKLCPIIEANAENMRHVTLCVCMRRGKRKLFVICDLCESSELVWVQPKVEWQLLEWGGVREGV